MSIAQKICLRSLDESQAFKPPFHSFAFAWNAFRPISALAKKTLFPVASTPQKLSPLMERELRGCFEFFWEEWNSDPKSPTYGMSNGDSRRTKYIQPHSHRASGLLFHSHRNRRGTGMDHSRTRRETNHHYPQDAQNPQAHQWILVPLYRS